MQSCARCGFVVYPAEKINCIDQVNHWAHWEFKQLFQILKNCKKKALFKERKVSDYLKIILNQTGLSRDTVINKDNVYVSMDLNIWL